MSRPTTLTIDALSKVLSPAAQTASELAARLGVSRATVHRKLLKLAEEQLVVKTGQGPKAGYRLPTPREEFERARAARAVQGQLRLDVSERLAGVFQSALEFAARLGIGQLEQVDELYRWGQVKRADGAQMSFEDYDQVRSHADHLKSSLLHLAPNASHGIFSPHVHPITLQSWQMAKALRHRMAWDRQPEGSIGVWHDEPTVEGAPAGFDVFSQLQPDGQRRYGIELTPDKAELLVRACRAYAKACEGDVLFLVDWAEAGELRTTDGQVPDGVCRMAGTQIAGWLAQVVQQGKGPAVSVGGHTAQHAAEALEAFLRGTPTPQEPSLGAGELNIVSADSSPFAINLEDLPEGMMLNFYKGKYRVIGPSRMDGALVILGESYSVQTAMAMARNHARGADTRSWSF